MILPVPVNGHARLLRAVALARAGDLAGADRRCPAPVPFAMIVTTLSAAWVVAVPVYFPVNTIGFFTAVAAAEAIAKANSRHCQD